MEESCSREVIEELFYLGCIDSKRIIEEFEEKILSLKNPALSYFFVKNIKGANWNKHLEVIEQNSKDEEYTSHADNLKLLLGIRK